MAVKRTTEEKTKAERKKRPHSGSNMTREQRRASGSPIISVILDPTSLAQLEVLMMGRYSPAQGGRSAVIRDAIGAYYRSLHGDQDPTTLLTPQKKSKKT